MGMKFIVKSIIVGIASLLSSYSLAETSADRAVLKSIIEIDIKTFKQLIAEGYDVNSFMDHEDEYWLMCEVARPGRFKLLIHAIKSGGDINLVRPKTSQSYSSPLMCAISHGNKQAFDYLLSLGADPNIVGCPECELEYQYLPLREALVSDQFQMAFELIAVTNMTELELEGIRYTLEDVRYLPNPETSQEEYRLKLASYLESKGYKLNIWTMDKEISGQWISKRDR